MTPLDVLIAQIVADEGGVKDVGDGKGITRYGQTPGWLAQFNLPVPQSPEDAAANYLKYIDMIGFRAIADAGDDLAWILLDIAVMSDHHKAIKALQAAFKLTVDGVLGRDTLDALAACDRRQMARDVIAWDMEYQGRLITLDPTRAQWAAGWAARIARHVRRLL